MSDPAEPKAKRPVGRPTKKITTVVDIILTELEAGQHVETACHLANVSKDAFYDWCERDPDFATKVHYARSKAIARLHNLVEIDDPKFILKNLAPKLYRDRIEQEISGADGGPIKLIVEDYRDAKEETEDETTS